MTVRRLIRELEKAKAKLGPRAKVTVNFREVKKGIEGYGFSHWDTHYVCLWCGYSESAPHKCDKAPDLSTFTWTELTHPFTCPVCAGNGLRPKGFYLTTTSQWSNSSSETETCRSCNGTGVVWSTNPAKS